jgi:CRISPR/Cas system CMR-associated protein Cmr5 small subunit
MAMMAMALGIVFMTACSVAPAVAPEPERPAVEAPAMDENALTKDYVDRAIAYFQANGLEKTVEFYSGAASIEGERYLIMVEEETRVVLTVPGREWLVGFEIASDGALAGVIEGATEEGRWVEGLGLNPSSKKTEPARYFVALRDGVLFLSLHFILRENVEETTKEYVAKAIARYQNEGLEAMVAHYNSRASMDGQFYLFMMDENDIYLVHPIFPHLIGSDIKYVVGSDGYELGKDIAKATEEGHWIEYLWPNPLTGNEESKVTWAIRHDGKIFASGYYTSSEEDVVPAWANADPRDYTVTYVNRAIERYASNGLDSLKAYYNSVASFEGQWYMFIMDENDIYIVHPLIPALIGTDIKDVVGSDGYELGKEIAKATEEGHWIEYLWPHPVTLKVVPKVGYAVRHDGMIFASGYYPLPPDIREKV